MIRIRLRDDGRKKSEISKETEIDPKISDLPRANMWDLPRDMVEEVLSRLPVTSLREVRSTCKEWNTLTKTESFLKKHIKKKQRKGIHQVVMMLEYRVFWMSFNLLCPSVEHIGNLDAGQVDDISKIIHCDGLFLLRMTKTKDDIISSIRLVVWNPYLGQTRWIEPRNSYHKWDRYGFFGDTVALSSVREEQLVVLFQKRKRGEPVKIWITTKIEPNAVSWSNLFLAVDMKPLVGFCFESYAGSFFVDEEKNVAVVLDKDFAYIIGKNGYLKQVDLGESRNRYCYPLVCSYVPSSVQIEQPAPLGNVLLY